MEDFIEKLGKALNAVVSEWDGEEIIGFIILIIIFGGLPLIYLGFRIAQEWE